MVAVLCQSIVRYVVVSYQLAGPAGYHPPQAVPPLSEKEGFASLHCCANQLDSTAITHPFAVFGNKKWGYRLV